MGTSQYIRNLCLVIAAILSYTIGLMTNVFIVGASVCDRLEGRPLTTADLLITAIGSSRIIFQFISLCTFFYMIFTLEYSVAYNMAYNAIGTFSIHSNIWFSVLLSVFYSLKIRNFNNFLFRCLRFISQRVLALIMVCALLSVGYTSVSLIQDFLILPKNTTQVGDNFFIARLIMYIWLLLWNALPFLFYVFSSILLLGSLGHHMYRMKRDNNVTAHLDAYIKTIKFTIVSFCCFAFYVSIHMFGIYFFDFFGLMLVWNLFPLLHSLYIIYMTARLRSHLFRILHGITCLLPNGGLDSGLGVQMQILS